MFQFLGIDELRNLSVANKFSYGCLVNQVNFDSKSKDTKENMIYPETFRELNKSMAATLKKNPNKTVKK